MAALAYQLSTLADVDALPEPQRALYVERDGRFVLDVEGVVPETKFLEQKYKLEEFRDRNRELHTKVTDIDALRAKLAEFDGIDAADAKALKSGLEKKGVKKLDELESLISDAIAKAIGPVQQNLENEKKAREAAQQRADSEAFRSQIGTVARSKGVREKALDYVMRRAEDTFTLKDGRVVAKDGSFSQDDPTRPLSTDEWLARLAKDEDVLFEASTGSGANGSKPTGGPGRTLINPDALAFGHSLEDIASGKADVRMK
ncbi:MAG TPA: hypothetical protein VNJ04_04645 [Gemmatimonadaceae bacterium]|nr:hypothetical protein [Gemmatimonadaceae bacterium]